MAFFIATVESPYNLDNSAIAIIDSRKGVRYLQQDEKPQQSIRNNLRGLQLIDDRLYVLAPGCLFVYQVSENFPYFSFIHKYCLPEWLLGGTYQANLYPLLIDNSQQKIYIGNNHFSSIDIISFNGQLLERKHLWEIAKETFQLPSIVNENFNYGHIRNLFATPDGRIFITIAFHNHTSEGVVIDLNTGEIMVRELNHPAGGLIIDDKFYILDSKEGKVLSFPLDTNSKPRDLSSKWSKDIRLKDSEKSTALNKVNLRGLCVSEDTVYVGVCDFFNPPEKSFMPFIAGIDKNTGMQSVNIPLQDFEIFRRMRINFIVPVEGEQFKFLSDNPICFFNGEKVSSITHEVFQKQKINFVKKATGTCYVMATLQSKETENKVVRDNKSSNVEKIVDDNEIDLETSSSGPHTAKEVAKPPTVILDNVSLCYRRGAEFFLSLNKQLRKKREYWALQDLSFTIHEDETVGLIGRNGSGKSTTSRLISGSLRPDRGQVKTMGKVQLLALGIGFRPQLTGRENIILSGAILGLSRREVSKKIEEIIDFAELDEFIDEPISTYSAGMKSRLGFGVSTAVNPNILILDEVMSTGDASFRNKANKRMAEMRQRTKTVIVVSHSSSQVRELCNRIIWLEKGRKIMEGNTADVLSAYEDFCKSPNLWLEQHYNNKEL